MITLPKDSQNVQPRARMELAIVSKLIERAAHKGYELRVLDHDSECSALVLVYDQDEYLGLASLVFGNDGYDLISDYTLGERMIEFLTPVLEFAQTLEPS